MPAISVIMPVYNGEPYLEQAVASILQQTERDFEFIILDDGSTDGSPKIIEDFAARDQRIRFYRDVTNHGVPVRLNQGIELAEAPLIARMDADDVSLPHRFAAQRAHLDANPNCVLVGSRVVVIDPDGDALKEMGDAFSHEEIDHGLMNSIGQLVYHPSVIIRKSALEAVGGYDETFPSVEDLDLFLKLAERGRMENLKEPLLYYREHFQKMGVTRLAEQEDGIDRAIAAASLRRGGENLRAASIRQRRTPESKADTYRKWGWWALEGGRIAAARKHARRALFQEPLSVESARLLWCAIRGH